MRRVIVTRPMVGPCFMQVCAAVDATDEEILTVCNKENPSGTANGWTKVIREDTPLGELWPIEQMKPIACGDNPGRKHFIVAC